MPNKKMTTYMVKVFVTHKKYRYKNTHEVETHRYNNQNILNEISTITISDRDTETSDIHYR